MTRRATTDKTVADLVRGLEVRDDTVAGRHGPIPVRRYRAPTSSLGAMVWVHGGAFAGGGLDQLESHAVAAGLAQQGLAVTAVDYHRVPGWSPFRDVEPRVLDGTRYPVPVDDVADVLAAESSQGPVVLGGASAGACLSAAAALRSIRSAAPVPRLLVLAYGTFHADLPPLSQQLRRRVRGRHSVTQFRASTVRRMNYNYAGRPSAMTAPCAFPGGHDKTGFPSTLCLDADRDTLRASGEAFARELRDAGVPVSYEIAADTTHGFLNRPAELAFHVGVHTIAEWIRSQGAHVS